MWKEKRILKIEEKETLKIMLSSLRVSSSTERERERESFYAHSEVKVV